MPALAGPEGGQIVGGAGSIDQSDLATIIQQETGRLAIDWESFDVNADESVTFIQPDASSIALNRILGNNGSEIHGRLNANGHVVLVNPHGVFFGESASINVGGLIASGLDIDPSDFMNGSLNFAAVEGADGKVVNVGLIQAATGGSVTLLGKQVHNDGLIMANLGAVNLAAGKEAVVTFDAAGLVGVRVTKEILQDELSIDAAVLNSGGISAAGGRILMTASTSQDIFSQAVNTGSLEQANSVVVHEDGSFTLGAGADVVNTGSLDTSVAAGEAGTIVALGENVTSSGEIRTDSAEGRAGSIELHAAHTTLLTDNSVTSASTEAEGRGGEIKVLGYHVGMFDSALIDASGATGGGDVYIGGDFQGKNAGMRNAWRTIIAADAQIYADALNSGDGGRVIVWADDVTRFHGSISARGINGGDGGFAEVSGKHYLHFDGTADLFGAVAGQLLLDPEDITINNGGGHGYEDNNDFDDTDVASAYISASSITGALSDADVTLEATDTIEITSDISKSGNSNSLTFTAGNKIYVADFVKVNIGSGDLIFIAGAASCGDADCGGTAGTRSFSLGSDARLNTTGNLAIYAADNIAIDGEIGLSDSPSRVHLRAGNDIVLGADSSIATNSDGPGLGSIWLSAGDAALSSIAIDHDFDSGSDSSTPARIVTVPTGFSSSVAPSESNYDATLGSMTLDGTLTTQGGQIRLDALGDVAVNANVTTGLGNNSVFENDEDALASNYTIFTSDFIAGGQVDIDAKGAVSIGDGIRIDTFGANFVVGSTGAGVASFTNNGTVSTSFADGGGDININAVGNVSLGTVEFSYYYLFETERAGSVTVDSGGNITLSETLEFNDTGPRTSGGVLSSKHNETTFLDLDASGDISIDAIIQDQNYGDGRDALDIYLRAGNAINVNADIYTSGGNFVAEGSSFDSTSYGPGVTESPVINTERANARTAVGQDGENGDAQWSNGGNIEIYSSSTISLGDIVTDGDCIYPSATACTGNLTISGANTAGPDPDIFIPANVMVTQADGSALNVAGNTIFNIGGGDVTLDNANTFNGAVSFSSAGDVVLTSSEEVDVGSSAISGDLTLTGAGVVDSGATSVGGVVTLNTGGGGVNFGGFNHDFTSFAAITASEVAIRDTNSVILDGIDTSDSDGDISINGDVVLENNVLFNADDGSQRGDITINGSVSSSTGTYDLTMQGGAIEFGQLGNTTNKLGAVSLDAIGVVSARHEDNGTEVASDLYVTSLDVTSSSAFTAGSIDTQGIADNSNGGAVSITSSGQITTGDIDTSGGAASGSDTTGGAITISGESLSLNGIRSVGYEFSEATPTETGNGGAVTLTATGGNVLLGGDINTEYLGGTNVKQGMVEVNANHSDSVVELNHSDFFTSDATVKTTASDVRLKGFNRENFWDITGDNTGWLTDGAGSSILTFSGIEHLVGNEQADSFNVAPGGSISGTIDGGGGTNTLDLSHTTTAQTVAFSADSSFGSAANEWVVVNVLDLIGNDVNSSLSVASGTNSWTVTGENSGTVTTSVSSGDPLFAGEVQFTGFTSIGGGSGADTFTVEAGAFIGSLLGGEGTDSVHSLDQANVWSITGPGSGEVAADVATPTGTVGFSGMENLIGGSLNDAFRFSGSGAVTGSVTGGLGNNSILSGSTGANWVVTGQYEGEFNGAQFSDIQELVGGPSNDTLSGPDEATTWSITGSKTGILVSTASTDELVSFSGMESLDGGEQDDDFVVTAADAGATISGGDGYNTLSKISGTNTWALDGAYEGTLNTHEFDGIHKVIGGSGTDSLEGRDQDNRWMLNGAGAGTISGVAGTDTLTFTNFETLIGQSSDDVFSFQAEGSISTINGAGGSNAIAGRDADSVWTLTGIDSGSLAEESASDTNTDYVGSFSNIENLLGGSGNDDFILSGPNGAITGGIDGGSSGAINAIRVERPVDVDWTVSGARAGSLAYTYDDGGPPQNVTTGFTNVDVLTGSAGTDTFEVDSLVAISLDGGASTDDVLNLEDVSDTDITIALGSSEPINGTLTVDNIAEIRASTDTERNNILIGYGDGSNWNITDTNAGSVQSIGTSTSITFSGFKTLQGSDAHDQFIFGSNGEVDYVQGGDGKDSLQGPDVDATWYMTSANTGTTDWISESFTGIEKLVGGTGDDTADFRGASTSPVDIGVGAASSAHVKLANFETLVANADDDHRLLGEDIYNRWAIDGSNEGTLNGSLAFSGITNLVGNAGDDTFSFETSGEITGTIDGGAGGVNELDLTGVNRELNITYSSAGSASGMSIQNISTLDGRNGHTNSLEVAGGSEWLIDGADSGVLNTDEIHFFGFGTLIGGDQNDRFMFTNAGSLSGHIDGGGETTGDIADFSALTNVDITVGGDAYRDIETMTGNGATAVLRGGSGTFDWTFANGENRGQVNDTRFEAFGTVVGGSGTNTFTVNGGWLSGAIVGGDAAQNNFNLVVNEGGTQSVRFEGGAGGASNVVTVTGGASGMNASHALTGSGEGQFSYGDYDFSFTEVTAITDATTLQNLEVQGTSAADNYTLTGPGYMFNGMTVGLANKTNLTLAAGANDVVTLGGNVNMSGTLSVERARLVTGDPSYTLAAATLQLDNVNGVGTSGGRLRVDLDNLALNGSSAAVYLDSAGDINISRFNTQALFDLKSEADIGSSVDLISSHALRLESEGGSLNLGRSGNALSGQLDLTAADGITLSNQGLTRLGAISSRTLNVTSSGAISGVGAMSVSGDATFSAGGGLSLQNDANTLNRVTIESADNATIRNIGKLTLREVDTTGTLTTSSDGLEIIGAVSSANVDANAGSGAATLSGAMDVAGRVKVRGEGVNVNGAIEAATIDLDGQTGNVGVLATLDSSSGDDIVLSGNRVEQQATITAGRNLVINATDDFVQTAAIHATDTVDISAGDGISVSSGAQTQARNLNYSAGGDLSLQSLSATDAISVASSAGRVSQSGEVTAAGNVTYDTAGLVMNAGSTLTSTNGSIRITSRGATQLEALTARSGVEVSVQGTLTTEKAVAATAGQVTLTASGDVTTQGSVRGIDSVQINSTGGTVAQASDYMADSGNVAVTAGRNISMGEGTKTTMESGSISYSAGQNIQVSELTANGGTVALASSGGAISQTSSGFVTAERLEIDAGAGIGADAPLNMSVSQLAVSNQRGSANIHNTGELTIDRFRSNGDITITNVGGNLMLNTAIGEPYKMGESDANIAGGTSNANYDQGSITIRLDKGDILATGPARADTPDIVAKNATIIAPLGDIGTPSRPLVLYVKDGVFIQGFRSWPPIWGFNTEPTNGMTNASSIQVNLMDLLNAGSEQLVEVESLEDIDPAVFANIQNFFYDDVSILLPEDQRWEE